MAGAKGAGAARSNPTALRTGGGRRLAGERTLAAAGRVRRARGGGVQGLLDQGRANNARRRPRVAGR